MSKIHCEKCDRIIEMPYWKWVLTAPFHTWTKRKTTCPRCGKSSYMRRVHSTTCPICGKELCMHITFVCKKFLFWYFVSRLVTWECACCHDTNCSHH